MEVEEVKTLGNKELTTKIAKIYGWEEYTWKHGIIPNTIMTHKRYSTETKAMQRIGRQTLVEVNYRDYGYGINHVMTAGADHVFIKEENLLKEWSPIGYWIKDGMRVSQPPNYCVNRDAIIGVVTDLITDKASQSKYGERLVEVINFDNEGGYRFIGASTFFIANADARQRAEAFILTTQEQK